MAEAAFAGSIVHLNWLIYLLFYYISNFINITDATNVNDHSILYTFIIPCKF